MGRLYCFIEGKKTAQNSSDKTICSSLKSMTLSKPISKTKLINSLINNTLRINKLSEYSLKMSEFFRYPLSYH